MLNKTVSLATRSAPSVIDQTEVRHGFPLGSTLEFLQSLWRLNRQLETLSSRIELRLGITGQQRLIIRCIGKYPGINVGQLADLLHIDNGTMSTALKRMESKRLIQRRRDPRDGRRVSLGLTPNGEILDRQTSGTVEDAVEKLLHTSGEAEVSSITKALDGLTGFLAVACIDRF